MLIGWRATYMSSTSSGQEDRTVEQIKGAFFWAYSGIGIVGINQTIVRSLATLIPDWL